MFLNRWHKRHVRKKGFRDIAILDTGQATKQFRPIYTRTKTMYKEVHTTLHRHDVFHNTYPLTLHLHSDAWYPHTQYVRNTTCFQTMYHPIYAGHFQNKAPIHSFQYTNSHSNFHLLVEEQMHLEQKYFQSHPSKARTLAMSYLQQGVLHSVLHEFLQSKEMFSNPKPLQRSKPTFLQQYVTLQQMEQLYKPVFVQSDVQTYYPITQKKEEIKNEQSIINKEEKKEVLLKNEDKFDMAKLVRYVYEEVMRKIRQEGLRKGRR